MRRFRSPLVSLGRRLRPLARRAAVRFGGLPHSEGTVDTPPPPVAHDISELWRRNLVSKEPIVDRSAREVVTMTTHGERIETVWLAIESIGRGDVLPGRLVLWLDGTPRRLPWRLRRLVKRGLEVRFTPAGLGVHTKYWPFVDTQPLDSPLITSDDDIVYPPPWLAGLRSAHARHPDSVIAYRAHRIRMSTPDEFSPYTSWPPSDAAEPSYANFGTSVSGQLLPPGLLEALREEGTRFLEEAPTADDVWLHRCAVTAGYVTALVETRSLHWWFIPGSQTSGLNHVNVAGGANDRQLAATHTDVTRARIWSSLERR